MTDLPRGAGAVVVGAGVIGCSIAYHLAKRGLAPVVLERDYVCAGNTRRSGALVRMHYDNEPEARVAFASLPYFRHWKDLVGYECGFVNSGAAVVVGAHDAERLRRNVAMLRSIGVNTQEITLAELKERQRFLVTDDLGTAAYEPDSGYADPVATTRAFARRAVDLGATIREGVRVLSLRVDAGRVRGLRTTAGDIDTDAVVLAAGPWTVALLRDAGIDVPVRPVRAEISFVRRPASIPDHYVYLDFKAGSYFRPTPDGLSLIGAGGVRREIAEREMDTYEPGPTDAAVAVIRDRIRQRAPRLADAPLARGHAGLYDMSADEKAILDRVPGVEGAYMAVGFSGTGFKKSPAVGACMAELICDGTASAVDIAPFRFARFTEGASIASDAYTPDAPLH